MCFANINVYIYIYLFIADNIGCKRNLLKRSETLIKESLVP